MGEVAESVPHGEASFNGSNRRACPEHRANCLPVLSGDLNRDGKMDVLLDLLHPLSLRPSLVRQQRRARQG